MRASYARPRDRRRAYGRHSAWPWCRRVEAARSASPRRLPLKRFDCAAPARSRRLGRDAAAHPRFRPSDAADGVRAGPRLPDADLRGSAYRLRLTAVPPNASCLRQSSATRYRWAPTRWRDSSSRAGRHRAARRLECGCRQTIAGRYLLATKILLRQPPSAAMNQIAVHTGFFVYQASYSREAYLLFFQLRHSEVL